MRVAAYAVAGVVALGAGCGSGPDAPIRPDADPTFETLVHYVGFFAVTAATDQTAPFDPPAFGIDDASAGGLTGHACASPDASVCDGVLLFTGATVRDGSVDPTTADRQIVLSHPEGDQTVQIQTCTLATACTIVVGRYSI